MTDPFTKLEAAIRHVDKNTNALISRVEKLEERDRRPPVVEPVSDPIGGITYDEAIRQRDAYKAASQAVKAEMLAKWGRSKMGRADYMGTLDMAKAWRWIRLLGLELAP